jgi:hypothetical protein
MDEWADQSDRSLRFHDPGARLRLALVRKNHRGVVRAGVISCRKRGSQATLSLHGELLVGVRPGIDVSREKSPRALIVH